MEIKDFESNSFKSREASAKEEKKDKPKAHKVAKGKVAKTKSKGLKKVADAMFAADFDEVVDYVIFKVAIPGVMQTISDSIENGLHMFFRKGETYAPKRSISSRISSSWREYYDDRDRDRDDGRRARYNPESNRKVRYPDDYTFEDKADAEEILEQMDNMIDAYDFVSVADFMEYAGITPLSTEYDYGWPDIHKATIVRTRSNEYIIKLPRAIPRR